MNTNNDKTKEEERIDLDQCSRFKVLDVDERRKCVTDQNVCLSCLNAGHRTFRCPKIFFLKIGDRFAVEERKRYFSGKQIYGSKTIIQC